MLEIYQHDGEIRELCLARPPVNALDPTLLHALYEAIQAAEREEVAGLILSGAPGLFSAGLDLPILLTLDRDTLVKVWHDFFGSAELLACSSMPCVAAVTGHSPAGGAVLAICCDYRIMARGSYQIGLNEVQVGLTVPGVIGQALARLTGPYRAERLLVSGSLLESDAALACGFIDELCEVDQVRNRALAWLQELLALPRKAMLETRAMVRSDLAKAFADPERLPIAAFNDGWFHPQTQRALRATVERIQKKS